MEGRKNEDKPQMIYYGHRSVAPVAAYPLIHSSLYTVFIYFPKTVFFFFLSLNSRSLYRICSFVDFHEILIRPR